MKQAISAIKAYLHKYPYSWLLIYPVVHIVFFFSLSLLPLEHTIIECGLDRQIPFCEWFIIPYFSWYIYLFGGVYFFYGVSREDFLRLSILTIGGMMICLVTCLVFPTAIAFRPDPVSFTRSNPLIWLVKFIYASDQPWNVFPSMHCYGAITITVAILENKAFRKKWWVVVGSLTVGILICLSTMFIKQHSALDFVSALALAAVIYPFAYRVNWKFLKGPDAAPEIRQTLRRLAEKRRTGKN